VWDVGLDIHPPSTSHFRKEIFKCGEELESTESDDLDLEHTCLFALEDRLLVRAEAVEKMGGHKLAGEFRVASLAVKAVHLLGLAIWEMQAAHEEWDKLQATPET
jgi:hypothetical protein